jgi:hypothetical protein
VQESSQVTDCKLHRSGRTVAAAGQVKVMSQVTSQVTGQVKVQVESKLEGPDAYCGLVGAKPFLGWVDQL